MLTLKSFSTKKKRNYSLSTYVVSDINLFLISGFKPVFVDINPKNLSMDENEIIKKVNKIH